MNSVALSVRTFFRNRVLDVISIASKPHSGIHILNGHFLSLDAAANARIFENMLSKLEKKGVKFVDFTYAAERISSKNIPINECLVAFTWDDGFEECFTKIKPVLDRRNIKACFFINPNFIDGSEEYRENFTKNIVMVNKPPMDWDMVKALHADGHIIGAHTLDHLSLNSDDKAFLVKQIIGSKDRIESVLNDSVEHFAFPFGQLKYISELGVEVACKKFPYVYSQSNYTNYFSFNGKIINRRHFECSWPVNHVIYFLKSKKF